MNKITLFEPNITNLEKKIVQESLNKNQISTYGYFNKLLENEINKLTGSSYSLATNSGSSALFVAFKSIGVKENEIIITQSYTFTATTNAILLNNSIPLLLDISKENLCLDLIHLESFLKNETFKNKKFTYHKKTKKKISCICIVLTLGIIPDLNKFKILSKKYNLKIVLDAACAIGHKFNGKKLSSFCDIVTYSLNGNKNITAGAGGILSTEKSKYYNFATKYSNNGKIMNAYNYKIIGFNLRMSSLNAAVGLAQMKRYKNIYSKKNIIRQNYSKLLSPLKLFNCNFKWGKYLPWMNFMILQKKSHKTTIIRKLRQKNFMVNNFWLPMHKQPTRKNFLLTEYKNTNYVYDRILVLPSSTFLKLNILKKISKIINKNIINDKS